MAKGRKPKALKQESHQPEADTRGINQKYSNDEYWNKTVYNLDPGHPLVIQRTKPVIDKVAEIISIHKNTKVLDIGCGAGDFTQHLAMLSDQVTGLDHSAYIFKKNKHHRLVIGDAMALKYPDNSFDIVFCANTLHHIPDYPKAIAEMVRVSKKYVVIFEPNPLNPFMLANGIMKKEERQILHHPLTLRKLLNTYLANTKIVFKGYMTNLLFTNSIPPKVLNAMPNPHFVRHPFGTEFLVIAQKQKD